MRNWVAERRLYYVYRRPNWEAYKTEEERRSSWKRAEYLGAFGENGLQAEDKVQPFEKPTRTFENGAGFSFMQTPTAIFRISLEHLVITRLFTVSAGETLLAHQIKAADGMFANDAAQFDMLAITDKRLVQVGPAGEFRWSRPLPANPRHSQIRLNDFPELNKFVISYYRAEAGGKPAADVFEYFDEQGKPLEVKEVELDGRPGRVMTGEPELRPRGARILHRSDYRAGAVVAAGGKRRPSRYTH